MKKCILLTCLLLSLTARAEKFPEACVDFFALVQTLGKDDPYMEDFLRKSQELREWWKTANKKNRDHLKAHCEARKAVLEQLLLRKAREK